jgi:uncharacterized membrane protein HdeD (DUF308 family)
MGAGIAMVVLGAILALGVRAEAPGIDIQTIGVILMLGGVAVLAHARRGTRHEHEVTRIEDTADPDQPVHTVREQVTDREIP